MPSPFPGMNPYLEHPELFPGLHHWLIMPHGSARIVNVITQEYLSNFNKALC
nr:DUF4058 family protein [Fischerella sp. JS2]